MGLLEELKNETAERRLDERREQALQAQRQARYEAAIKPGLETVYGYLYQFIAQLNYLKPDICVNYQLPGDIALADLEQGGYSLKVDSREYMREVTLRFYCQTPGEVFFEVDDPVQFDKLRDLYHQHRLRYRRSIHRNARQTVLGGQFSVEKVVPIYFQFSADIENGNIVLEVRNFEALGVRRYVLQPEKIDEALLDEVGKYILRKVDVFMRLDMEEERLQQLRARIEQDKRNKVRDEGRRVQGEAAKSGKVFGLQLTRQIKRIYNKVKKPGRQID